MSTWTSHDIPDQHGRVAVITGANTGLGFATARMLALRGADVVLACRNLDKGKEAALRIEAEVPSARVSLAPLDLSDLQSVSSFAARMHRDRSRLDLLINNAGVMVPPLGRTAQGHELQLGTNHLGHFALTGRLLPLLEATTDARVVVVSSLAHRMGQIAFDDLDWERRGYRAWKAYGQSKLANLMFALELHERLTRAGSGLRVTAAHPGWTATELQRTDPLSRFFNPFFAMKPSEGALPTLRAATDPEAPGGSYWGPSGIGELRGAPVLATISKRALDERARARLWEMSESLTGVRFDLGSARRAA